MDPHRLRTARRFARGLVVAALPLLAGCGAARKMIRYRELVVDTEVTETIFLEPTARPRTVYLEVRNTSGAEVELVDDIAAALVRAGYEITPSPEDATYLFQANVLQLRQRNLDEDEDLSDALREAAAAGAVAGALVGVVADAEGAWDEVALLVGVGAFIADAATTRRAFALTADVRITEVLGPNRREHRTRIIGGASKVNLQLREALPALTRSVGDAIGGMMAPGGPATRPTT